MTTDTTAPMPPALAELIDTLKQHLTPSDPPLLVDASEAARLLGISRASFYRGVSAGGIPAAVKTSGGPRWRRADLAKHVERLKAS